MFSHQTKPLCGCGIVYLLTVQVSVLYCSASVHWLLCAILSRFLTLSPSRATVLDLHWIRFVSWLKAQVVIVCYITIIV